MRRNPVWARLSDESGFTLVELLVVAVIILILSTIALEVVSNANDKAWDAHNREDLRRISQAVDRYYTDNHRYPDNLNALVTEGYLKPTSFAVAWSDLRYFFAFEWTDNKKETKTYIVGVPKTEELCKLKSPACNPSEDAPLLESGAVSSRDFVYFIQSQ